MLVEMDYDAYHLRLIADVVNYKFPKGETAILTAVEKKFGEDLIGSAQETIHKMTAGNDQEIEKIKKLAGVK